MKKRYWIPLALVLGFVLTIRFIVLPSMGDPKMILQALFGTGIETPDAETVKSRFTLPDGLGIRLYHGNLPNVRMLLATPEGRLLATTPRTGTIHRIDRDADGDGVADGRSELLSGLNKPHGMLFRDGWLYIAETDAVQRIAYDVTTDTVSGELKTVLAGLPGGGNHWARNLMDGGDGWIYINIGSSCNVCEEADARRAAILRFRPDGSAETLFAAGLRNSTAMAIAPWDGRIWAADISRDMLGDDFPVDELNLIEEGGFYGWPYANENKVPDPDFGESAPAKVAASIAPVLGFPAHTSPLDIHFIQHPALQARFGRAALVTLHGSWNRSKADGYRVELLRWNSAGAVTREPFLDGFLQGAEVVGRPVDIVEDAQGTLYLSDDYAGAIYAIAEGKSQSMANAANKLSYGKFDAELLAQGEALYLQYQCDSCHGAGASAGGGKPIDLSKVAGRYTPAQLADFFTAPNPPMPVFPLSAREREALAASLLERYRSP